MTGNEWSEEELKAKLIGKAWEDEAFKQRLLNEPKATIERELGVKLPDDIEIQVIDETANKVCLVLPQRPEPLPETELSEEQLEAVAGGGLTDTIQPTLTCVGGFSKLQVLTTTLPVNRMP